MNILLIEVKVSYDQSDENNYSHPNSHVNAKNNNSSNAKRKKSFRNKQLKLNLINKEFTPELQNKSRIRNKKLNIDIYGKYI